ncbi:MAG: CAAX prenyl protease-related protein [Usitatibacter sp.]
MSESNFPPEPLGGRKFDSDTIFPWASRVAPFAVFIGFLAAQPYLDRVFDPRWVVVTRGLAVAAVLALLWRNYVELHREQLRAATSDWLLAVAVGVGVFFFWIEFSAGWSTFGEAPAGFVPLHADGSVDALLVGLRLFGLALAVPVMEELFWRSFLMRRIDSAEFLHFDPRRTSLLAIALSSALFALEHSQWFAGLIAGAGYAWLYMRSRSLLIPIVSHATTNAILGTWILATGSWTFW